MEEALGSLHFNVLLSKSAEIDIMPITNTDAHIQLAKIRSTVVDISQFSVHGLVRGLMLFSDRDKAGEHIWLINPLTSALLEVDKSTLGKGDATYWLGYDTFSEDYKILSISATSSNLYSLKTHSWKWVFDARRHSQCLVTIALNLKEETIAIFNNDIVIEKRELEFVLGDHLGLCIQDHICVTQSYGDESSWTEVGVSIQKSLVIYIRGNLVISSASDMMVYDPKTKSIWGCVKRLWKGAEANSHGYYTEGLFFPNERAKPTGASSSGIFLVEMLRVFLAKLLFLANLNII